MPEGRDLLAAATPRPWRHVYEHRVVGEDTPVAYTFSSGVNQNAVADAALIVRAVNEYAALLDCVDPLRAATTAGGPASLGVALSDARAALARLDALRSQS